jgi:8-oxo-dGTP pyrophosphatase MutT (NUDIX family)
MNKQELISIVENYIFLYPTDIHGIQVLDFLNTNDIFWQRTNESGHITASAWVINADKSKALLTHHLGLDMWFQLGGHIEESDNNIYEACQRELMEESGSKEFRLLSAEIFDIDVHRIPESKKGVPAHFHYDIRLLFEGNSDEKINYDHSESNEVAWLSMEEIKSKTQEWSVMRMVEKTINS